VRAVEAVGEAVRELGQGQVGGPLEPRVELGHRRPLALHPPLHRGALPVPAVERRQRTAQALHRVRQREQRRQVGPRVLRQVVRRAGRQQGVEIGEVVVDRQPLHPGAPGDVGHGRPPDADLLVQRGGRRGDAVVRRLLRLGAGLQLVSALFA
jgi:hypothetical protein